MRPSAAEALKAAIRRSLPLTLALVLLGALAVTAIRQYQGPRYQASARIVQSTSDLGQSVLGVQTPYTDPQRVIDTATTLAGSPELYDRVVAEGDVDKTAKALRQATKITGGADTDVFTFTVVADTPDEAITLVNKVAAEYVQWRGEISGQAIRQAIDQIQAQLDAPAGTLDAVTGTERAELTSQLNRLKVLDTLNSGGATIVERAETAVKTSPRPIRDALFGAALGLVIALLLAGVREAFNTRIRSEADVEDALGRPVLASIQSLPKRTAIVTAGRHESRWGDTYALLAANIMQIRGDADRTILAVTSAIASEGKTTTATNLAVAMAQRGQKVILVDFDLRKPSVGRVFKIPAGSPGVVQVIDGKVDLSEARWSIPLNGGPGQPVAARNGRGPDGLMETNGNGSDQGEGSLQVIAAGGNERGARIARSAEVIELLDELAAEADVVVLDTPPALATVEMAELSRMIDLAITVVRYGKVTRRSLIALNRQADTWQTDLVGAVITDAPPEEDDYYYYR
jgi:succinoglycan biosynthesis transport protein ExoP